MISGCLLLNVCLVALLYDPVEKHLKKVVKVKNVAKGVEEVCFI